MSCSLCPMPLPSWVQRGRIILPVKSKCSKNVNTAMGMVSQQLGESGSFSRSYLEQPRRFHHPLRDLYPKGTAALTALAAHALVGMVLQRLIVGADRGGH